NFVVQDGAGGQYTISSTGMITLKTSLSSGAAYALSVTTQPTNQFCNIQNASGTAGSSTASNASIACAQLLAGGSGSIPSAGGSFSSAVADVVVPAGASLQPQNIAIATIAPPAGIPAAFVPVGAAVDVSVDQPAALNAPLLVTLRYDASIVSDESN